MSELLSVRGLVKNHGQVRVLKGVDLAVAAGEIVGLVGGNGAGKSTLISVLSGATQPNQAEVLLDGQSYRPSSDDDARERGVGTVHQRFKFSQNLTVLGAIAGFDRSIPEDRAAAEATARGILEESGVQIAPDAMVNELMRAEQAIIGVLRLQFEAPRLILLDEVAAAFNDQEVALVHAVVRRLARQGTGIIYITHRIDEIRSLADRILVMRDGLIKDEFIPREVKVDDIVYSMFERRITQQGRPGAVEGSPEEVLRVEGASTASGLTDVSFVLHRGEVLGLTGLRRAGMSELVAALVGSGAADFTTLRVGGQDVTINSADDAVRLGIGYLSDTDDELEAALEDSVARRLMKDDYDPHAGFAREISALREVAAQVKTLRIQTHDIQSQVGDLSGGDQQKIALARWMRTECDVLILNHPTRGIDVGSKGDVYDMLRELTERGTAVLLVSSEMTELLQWCHRILVMRDGQIVAHEHNEHATEDTLMSAALGEDF
ncbi:sugar ABC transporter ATP-binding protein [Kocuria sp.]|uniref:sugar ABC transporter ATP-binding protein n=1 Tax=Kocuria sp. TaxID=1871328 RepID=UPI0026DF03F5|nr:sugar ABC transporter ATP-binding protein [Kocuria sp.]MDO5618680.1 sugar ABC transporter ATP-binding protein [Kocuria sp.]